ncbi:MAG: N-formylglutamate amidohydrolase [Geminicoccaceae bacterium]
MTEARAELLVAHLDPPPVEEIRPSTPSPLLLICEHAGQAIPDRLGALGLSKDQCGLHIAYDIGAEKVARALAQSLGSALIMQRYSRLVIDCNRPPGSAQSIPVVSDEITIPGNADLSEGERREREMSIFEPYAERCQSRIGSSDVRFAFSIHSFTPEMSGEPRPWDLALLYRSPASQGDRLSTLARAMWPALHIGCNQPYQIEDETDWFIPVCAEPRGIPHCLIEIRNDHLLTDAGCLDWADRLHRLLSAFVEATDETDP